MDKPDSLQGSNPTAHLTPAFGLPYTLQVNLRPLPTGFPFDLIRCLMLLLCNKAAKPQCEPLAAAALASGVIALESSERSNSLNY